MAKPVVVKCKKGECEECPEWIFTFADLVMLMMGFFVILWVLKPSPTPKTAAGSPDGKPTASAVDQHWVDAVVSIREAFDGKPKEGSNDPIDVAMRAKRDRTTPAGPRDQGRAQVKPNSPAGVDDEATMLRPSKHTVVGGAIGFDRGRADLSAETLARLDAVAEQVRGHRYLVLVQGHTGLDDFDDAASAEVKLSLSLRRAEAVADRLTADGVSPDVLRVVGCSTYEPLSAGQYTADAQAGNRRVEVVMTGTLAADAAAARPPTR